MDYKVQNKVKQNLKENKKTLRFEFDGVMRYIPLIVCGGFFFFTILIFAFGPLEWNISNPLKLYAFLILCCIALVAGYVLAVKKGRISKTTLKININTILIVCAIIYLILYIPTLLTTTGKWYPDIVSGIMDTGKAYRTTKYLNENGNNFVIYIRIFLSPFMIMITPITLFFMPKLSKISKVLGWTVIISVVCLSISQGMNKACADFTAQIVLFLCMLFFTKANSKSNFRYRFKIVILILFVCSLFFAYYSTSMRNRVTEDQAISKAEDNSSNTSKSDVSKDIMNYSTFGFAVEKKDYILMKLVPDKLKPTATFLSSYLSHGYKGLSIAMEQNFTSTYGLGFSDFFRHNLMKSVGETDMEKKIISKTYYGKTSVESWETGFFWSTFFVYPASDISFIGTILLVFIIGYLFALSWKDALTTENPFAITSFFGFCTMIFYFSANNQMFQGGENFIGFISMLILWFISRSLLFKRCH